MSLLKHTPTLSLNDAKEVAERHYGIQANQVKLLPSERDQNFRLTTVRGKKFILKIANGLEEKLFLEAQTAMMRHLEQSVDVCPTVISDGNGRSIIEVETDDSKHWVRLVSYLEGETLSSIAYRAPQLLADLGKRLGQMTCALGGFDHTAFHRNFQWDLANARQVIDEKLDLIEDEDLKQTIQYFSDQFDRNTLEFLDALPKSVIHSDANDGNIIVSAEGTVAGIIDFGDAIFSWRVGDIAIAIAYAILDQTDPLSAASRIVASFHEESKLSADELDALFGLICMRLCVSAVIASDQQQQRPNDPYLAVSQAPIRRTLPMLMEIPFGIARTAFRLACGFEPVANQTAEWLRQEHLYRFPIGIEPKTSNVAVLDLSVSSTLMPQDLSAISVADLTSVIFDEMKSRGSMIGVGRYLEPRLVYRSEQFGSAIDLEKERRTVHLGVDLFAMAGTPVLAPLAGTVHGVIGIDLPLDYGNLVFLRHEPEPGVSFFTIYGHLAERTRNQVSVGQEVQAGETIGWLGDENENGGWPPHLHFQIMLDLLGYEKDFPGVCLASQSALWSVFCPDPNLILGLSADVGMDLAKSKSQTLADRIKRMGPSLSIGYEDPLKIVRGWQHWLYDETGRQFLDAYNNVPHVGHCHPLVARALADQACLLNTNTRYLSDGLGEFARRLAATMPDPLSVCFFLNSASEANELALRLARAYTGQKDLIVLEGAYHGHTTTLIDISPYKHDGPGGGGGPDWVHTVALADIYRGRFKDPATAGKKYAAAVGTTIDRLKSNGKGLCGFIAESCPSVGGQIIFPDGYLTDVYQSVRAAGGICIADDVQTGYGRLGKAYYGFELQNVVPDIVVLGKPIGNGHPIAALVTTGVIAKAFDNGMEFFSTFGGNNVSCQVGIAVLDIIQNEGLQQKAFETGEFILSELEKLKSKHGIIGDIRGSGLFWGIELVDDHITQEPAAKEVSSIINRMRDRGILIGSDGPLHNVLKIRPPMTFGIAEARLLIDSLDRCFCEL